MTEDDALKAIETAMTTSWNLNYDDMPADVEKFIDEMQHALALAEDEIKDARSRLRWVKSAMEGYGHE